MAGLEEVAKCCREQVEAGPCFSHEHPAHASWTTKYLRDLASEPGVLYVHGAMCRFEIRLALEPSMRERSTGFVTSCKHVWQTLDGKCGNLIRGALAQTQT